VPDHLIDSRHSPDQGLTSARSSEVEQNPAHRFIRCEVALTIADAVIEQGLDCCVTDLDAEEVESEFEEL